MQVSTLELGKPSVLFRSSSQKSAVVRAVAGFVRQKKGGGEKETSFRTYILPLSKSADIARE